MASVDTRYDTTPTPDPGLQVAVAMDPAGGYLSDAQSEEDTDLTSPIIKNRDPVVAIQTVFCGDEYRPAAVPPEAKHPPAAQDPSVSDGGDSVACIQEVAAKLAAVEHLLTVDKEDRIRERIRDLELRYRMQSAEVHLEALEAEERHSRKEACEELGEVVRGMKQSHGAQLHEMQRKVAALEAARAQMEIEVAQHKEQHAKDATACETLTSQLQVLQVEQARDRSEQSRERLGRQLQRHASNQLVDSLDLTVTSLRHENGQMKTQAEELRARVVHLEAQVGAQHRLRELQSKLAASARAQEQLEEEVAGLEEQHRRDTTQLTTLREQSEQVAAEHQQERDMWQRLQQVSERLVLTLEGALNALQLENEELQVGLQKVQPQSVRVGHKGEDPETKALKAELPPVQLRAVQVEPKGAEDKAPKAELKPVQPIAVQVEPKGEGRCEKPAAGIPRTAEASAVPAAQVKSIQKQLQLAWRRVKRNRALLLDGKSSRELPASAQQNHLEQMAETQTLIAALESAMQDLVGGTAGPSAPPPPTAPPVAEGKAETRRPIALGQVEPGCV